MLPTLLRLMLPSLLLASSCSGGDSEPAVPDANLSPTEFTITNMDSSGETHSLTIRCDDLLSDEAVTLRTDGSHQHAIRLEVADLQAVLAGMPVTVLFTEGHEHSFTIVKPAEACLGV